MAVNGDTARALAARLRQLRAEGLPGTRVTQPLLANALGVSVPLISSWESLHNPALPPRHRLSDYAHFFATARSVDGRHSRLVADLTEDERTRRDELENELFRMHAAIAGTEADTVTDPAGIVTAPVEAGPWHFPDNAPITIVCAPLPAHLRADKRYTSPRSPDYIELYTYADLDALIELHGHIRAANPAALVNFRLADQVNRDHLTTHLVLLGGVDWNPLTREILEVLRVPVAQRNRQDEPDQGAFVVTDDAQQVFLPTLRNEDGEQLLVEDAAHFFRAANPFNRKRTVTICNGNYGRGVYGSVRTLTDARFRDRNADYLKRRFPAGAAFSILARVQVVAGEVVTPDWTQPGTVLHEWSEAGE